MISPVTVCQFLMHQLKCHNLTINIGSPNTDEEDGNMNEYIAVKYKHFNLKTTKNAVR
jgi:hypothetical protein